MRADTQFNLRLPADMHEAIKDSASRNGRSINAELVYRLSTWKQPGAQEVGGVDVAAARDALALIKQLDASARSAYEACQKLGIKL